MSFNQEQLTYAESVLAQARGGSEEAIAMIRDVIEAVGREAPTKELLEIADFTFGFLRRQIAEQAGRN